MRTSSVATDLKRDLERWVRERDAVLVQVGRRAHTAGGTSEGPADGEIARLQRLLADRRSKLEALDPLTTVGLRGLEGVSGSLRRLGIAATLVLATLGIGWAGFQAVSLSFGAASVVTSAARVDQLSDAVCWILCGRQVTQGNGVTTEEWESSGTGFAISPEGYILTNAHVIEDVWPHWDAARGGFREVPFAPGDGPPAKARRSIWVFFGKGKKFEAKIVHYDYDKLKSLDIALLKIDREDGRSFRLSTVARPSPGTEVTALGFPDYASREFTEGEGVRSSSHDRRVRNLRGGPDRGCLQGGGLRADAHPGFGDQGHFRGEGRDALDHA